MVFFKETDETLTATQDHLFETFVDRIETSGGKILEDQKVPLYCEIGPREVESGYERTIHFTMKNEEFMAVRKVENYRISGAGKIKSLEKMDRPHVNLTLKKKDNRTDAWQIVDLDKIF